MFNFKHIACGVLATSLMTLAHAQSHTTPPENAKLQKQEIAKGDPARWYQDDSTPSQQMRTLRKEIAAAFQEANIACKREPGKERASCLKDARDTYRHDMANAKQILDENNRLE